MPSPEPNVTKPAADTTATMPPDPTPGHSMARDIIAGACCALSVFALVLCVGVVLSSLTSTEFAADFDSGTDTFHGFDGFPFAAIAQPVTAAIGALVGRGSARLACLAALAAPGCLIALAIAGAPLLALGVAL